MAENVPEWTLPRELQPQAEALNFDLDAVMRSVVMLRAEAPADAFTALVSRHGSPGQRRGNPPRRAGAHHRLSHY